MDTLKLKDPSNIIESEVQFISVYRDLIDSTKWCLQMNKVGGAKSEVAFVEFKDTGEFVSYFIVDSISGMVFQANPEVFSKPFQAFILHCIEYAMVKISKPNTADNRYAFQKVRGEVVRQMILPTHGVRLMRKENSYLIEALEHRPIWLVHSSGYINQEKKALEVYEGLCERAKQGLKLIG